MLLHRVLLGIDLRTSFLTPLFSIAPFYLRSEAPKEASTDAMTERTIPAVRTGDIHRGVMHFVALQLIVLALVIAYPPLLLRDTAGPTTNSQAVERALREMDTAPAGADADDPMRLMLEQLEDEANRKR